MVGGEWRMMDRRGPACGCFGKAPRSNTLGCKDRKWMKLLRGLGKLLRQHLGTYRLVDMNVKALASGLFSGQLASSGRSQILKEIHANNNSFAQCSVVKDWATSTGWGHQLRNGTCNFLRSIRFQTFILRRHCSPHHKLLPIHADYAVHSTCVQTTSDV